MHGNFAQRLGRIPLALLRRPQDLLRYVSQSPWNHRSPLELELPWFSYAAIDFLAAVIKPTDRVCELGGGGSTLWFAQRAGQVVTLESDPAWAALIRTKLPPESARKVEIIESPLPPPFTPFDPAPYLAPLQGRQFDWIVLDFMDDEFDRRPAALPWLEQHLLNRGGALIVDDAWRYPSLASKHLAKTLRFPSLGPARYGVTRTDIHYYQPTGESS
jgi:predicted O-methyltransferase YrrM